MVSKWSEKFIHFLITTTKSKNLRAMVEGREKFMLACFGFQLIGKTTILPRLGSNTKISSLC